MSDIGPFARQREGRSRRPIGGVAHVRVVLDDRSAVEGDVVIPVEDMPEKLRESMGADWKLRTKNRKLLEEQAGE